MNAAVLEGVNLPVTVKSVPTPTIQNGEALVQIRAAALNHRDVWIQKGQYAGLKFPIILGSDGAGVVVDSSEKSRIGKSVVLNPSLEWGTNEFAQQKTFRILGLPDDGSFAEFVKIPLENLFEKPAHLSWEEAAACPLAGLTAYRALFARAKLQPKEKVLITGIGGGVALFALQFGLLHGAEVWVTSGSDEKIAKAIEMGAKGGANYKNENWESELGARDFDVIVDSAGGEDFVKLVETAAAGGRLVFIGATKGNPAALPMRRVFWKQLSILGSTMGSPKDFSEMMSFINQKKMIPTIDDAFALSETEQALRRMEDGAQFGKIILNVAT
jgi:NADPH:quinone reductase-like Zn-dependent oxidoreductase